MMSDNVHVMDLLGGLSKSGRIVRHYFCSGHLLGENVVCVVTGSPINV